MIKEKILKLANVLEEYGQNILEPASNEEIEAFQKWVIDKYGEIDIDEYIYLVKLANGIEFNGLVIYSLKSESEESIYDSNDIWHENINLKEYLFYGDSDITWYCFDVNNKIFSELDKPSGEVIKTYETFNDMLNVALGSVM